MENIMHSIRLRTKNWLMVPSGIMLLALLNSNQEIHQKFVALDTSVALTTNSIIGLCPAFDMVIAWLNTRVGDVFVLSIMCTIFLVHSFCGSNTREIIRRLTFWGWVGVLCLIGYGVECALEPLMKREIPLLVMPQLKNVQFLYGIVLRTDPNFSFPSGHATAYILFTLMAWRRYFKMSLLIGCIGLVMLSMRLAIGIHWLSDMLLGALPCCLLIASVAVETPFQAIYRITEKAAILIVRILNHQLVAFRSIYLTVIDKPHRIIQLR